MFYLLPFFFFFPSGLPYTGYKIKLLKFFKKLLMVDYSILLHWVPNLIDHSSLFFYF